MNPKPWALSPAYTEFARSVRELHHMAAEGREESPEADEIREASDGPWHALSEVERTRASGLSGDLDTLVEPQSDALPMNPQAQSKLNEFYEARERGDWDRALALLRRWAKYISPALLAYLRGTAWLGAGDRESASLFFKRAYDLAPENPGYFVSYVESADGDEVRPLVDEILQRPESHPLSILSCSIVAARRSETRLSPEELRRFAAILEDAIRRTEADASLDDPSRVHALLLLGSCRQQLGENQEASEAYTHGLAIDPDNTLLLSGRGIIGYGSDLEAIRDLERAVRYRVDFFWPYFLLAHHRFREGRFPECLRLCEDALKFDGPETAKSELAEWTAIARARMGFSPGMVREAFDEAVRLDPSNERARRNRQSYESSLVSPQAVGARPFEARTPREVRASVPLGIGLKGAA